MNRKNPVLGSMICGIISNVLNLIMTCAMFGSGSFRFGGIFIIIPISGLITGISSLKQGSGIPGIIAIILNAIGTLGALGFILLGFLGLALS